MVGVLIKSDDYVDLYVSASLVASLVLRGDEVYAFITGRAVRAFTVNRSVNVAQELKRRGMDYVDILSSVKELGKLHIYVCTGMLEALGIDKSALDPIVDGVSTFTDFVMNNEEIIVS